MLVWTAIIQNILKAIFYDKIKESFSSKIHNDIDQRTCSILPDQNERVRTILLFILHISVKW